MHAGNVVECLRDANPAREHGDIGDEADIAHELVAFGPGIASKYAQFSLIWSEAENRVERSGFTCAVGTDEPENAAFFDVQINAIQRNGFSERFTETASFYAGHSFSAPLFLWDLRRRDSSRHFFAGRPGIRHRKTPDDLRRSEGLPP